MQSSIHKLEPTSPTAPFSSRTPRLVEARGSSSERMENLATPLALFCELSHTRFSGVVTLSMTDGKLNVILQGGLIAWAEHSAQRRSLGNVLCELFEISNTKLHQLAASWRQQGLSLAQGVLAQPGMSEQKLRRALQEHLTEALSGVTASPPCPQRRTISAEPAPYASEWLFNLDEVLRAAGRGTARRESIAELSQRVYGASWVDLVSSGSVAGLKRRSDGERRMLEAADELLLGHDDGVALAVVGGGFGVWAGLPAEQSDLRCNTWLGFEPEIGLGGAYLGLQAVCPRLDPLRALPSPPSLNSIPSLFPAADSTPLNYRDALLAALELSDGALSAHVLERDVICWGTSSTISSAKPAFMSALTRASGLLELFPSSPRDESGPYHTRMDNFVMLDGSHGFHVGTRVPGTSRTFLFFTFAPGSSYGSSIAALSMGASSLGRHIASAE